MGRFFDELKRRGVIRVGVAYLVVAWLLLQITDVLTSLMDLPSWIGRLMILLLAVGLPISLIFAWAFDITPGGIKPESEVDRVSGESRISGRKFTLIIVGALAAGVFVLLLGRLIPVPAGVSSSQDDEDLRKSIAVLPFVNLSEDQSQDYFVDGMTDELLNALTMIKNLRATSRTSS